MKSLLLLIMVLGTSSIFVKLENLTDIVLISMSVSFVLVSIIIAWAIYENEGVIVENEVN